jgi:hypothetical protein
VFSVVADGTLRSITATNISVIDNEWYHITVVKTKNFLYLYINDLSLTLVNHSETVQINPTSEFTIGGNKHNFFNGTISQIAIWKKALLTHEIAEIREEEDITNTDDLITIISFIKEEIDSMFPENLGLEVHIKVRNTSYETLNLQNAEN